MEIIVEEIVGSSFMPFRTEDTKSEGGSEESRRLKKFIVYMERTRLEKLWFGEKTSLGKISFRGEQIPWKK